MGGTLKFNSRKAKKYYIQDEKVLKEAEEYAASSGGQLDYISRYAGFPVYKNTGADYYSLGEDGFPVMLEEMRKARHYIFLEYFIIEPGQMWDSMFAILKEKVAEGVEIRVMYDDMGSMNTLPSGYVKTLEEYGIKGCAFNRINPVINGIMNHRDHRKILVIDGQVAFTGGINLADEYINAKTVYGHWKDNCIRIKGEAVWSYLVMFLSMWNALKHEDGDYKVFRAEPLQGEQDGYIAPYSQTPFSEDKTAQNIYENILNQAKDYCYIFTPYLIIDSDLTNTLTLAAKRGVDVKIMTPGIPDKKLIYNISRSYYENLIKGGVKIYEYTPGFDHAKVFVCDDKVATVGTINLDYRSLYLHFENGTYLYGSREVLCIRDDFLKTLKECRHVELKNIRGNLFSRVVIGFVRLFAPMM